MISSSFDFVVGTDNNLLKGVCGASQSFANISPVSDTTPTLEITRIAWIGDNDSIYFGRSDGAIGKMSFNQAKVEPLSDKLDSAICGLEVIDKKNILVCTKNGTVSTYHTNKSAVEKMDISAGPNLFTAHLHKCSSSQLYLASGGQNNDLKLFDISSGKKDPIFSAKNLANDWLSLQQPVWIRELAFIDETGSKQPSHQCGSDQLPKMVTVTDNGFLRVYDPKAQRRPVVNVSLVEHPLTSVAVFPYTSSPAPLPFIAAGSAQGWLGIVDLRQPRAALDKPLPGNCIVRHRLSGRCRGITGSVRALACLPRSDGPPLVVAGGLDRYLRVFDSSLPKSGPIGIIYTKSKLNCLAVSPTLNVDKLFKVLSAIDRSAPLKKRARVFEERRDAESLPRLIMNDDDDDDDDDDSGEDDDESGSDGGEISYEEESCENDDDDDEQDDDDDDSDEEDHKPSKPPAKRKNGRR